MNGNAAHFLILASNFLLLTTGQEVYSEGGRIKITDKADPSSEEQHFKDWSEFEDGPHADDGVELEESVVEDLRDSLPELIYGYRWFASDPSTDHASRIVHDRLNERENQRKLVPVRDALEMQKVTQQTQDRPRKRKGQEEFLTFVDPIRPKTSHFEIAPKLALASLSVKKRIANERSEPGDSSDTFFIVLVAGCATIGVMGVTLAGVMFTSPAKDSRGNESDESDGEGDEGDFSVYECPGLAPTGDLEISNPMFENSVSGSPLTNSRTQQSNFPDKKTESSSFREPKSDS